MPDIQGCIMNLLRPRRSSMKSYRDSWYCMMSCREDPMPC